MDIDNGIKGDALYSPESSQYMQTLCAEIERIGLDKYKEVLDEYNDRLEQLQKSGELPTPQQIVDSINRGEPINLQELIEKKEMEHSAEGDLKEVAEGENEKTQQGIVSETKEGATQQKDPNQEKQSTGEEK